MSYSGNLPMGEISLSLTTVPGSGPVFDVTVADPLVSFQVTTPSGTVLDCGPDHDSLVATLTFADGGTTFPGSLTAPVYASQVELTLTDL